MLQSCLSSPRSPVKALHRCASVAAALAVLAASGCWEEIRYQGPAPAAESPRHDLGVAPAAETEDATPPPAETGAVLADEVSADELFGEAPTPEDDAPGEPAAAGDAASMSPPEGDRPSSDAVIDAEPAATEEPVAAPVTPAAGRAPITSAQRLDAWTVASAWSLAAAVAAKGFDSEKYEPFLAEARRSAAALGVALPPLPASDGEQQRVAATIDALRNGAGPQLVEELILRLDPAAGIAARLAIESHLLLLWYTPRAADAIAATVAIQAAGEASELPVALWQPLVELLQKRAEFVEVRAAVFALHQAVAEHFAGK